MVKRIKFIYDGNYTRRTFQDIEKRGFRVHVGKLQESFINHISAKEGGVDIQMSEKAHLYIGNSQLQVYKDFQAKYQEFFLYDFSPIVDGKEKRVDTLIANEILTSAKDYDFLVLFTGDGDFVQSVKNAKVINPRVKVCVISSSKTFSKSLMDAADYANNIHDNEDFLSGRRVCPYLDNVKKVHSQESADVNRVTKAILSISPFQKKAKQDDVSKRLNLPSKQLVSIIKRNRESFSAWQEADGTWYLSLRFNKNNKK